MGSRVHPGVFVVSAVAVEHQSPRTFVSDDDEATIVLVLESEERHEWAPIIWLKEPRLTASLLFFSGERGVLRSSAGGDKHDLALYLL
jgi:hypothetical protein